MQLSIVQYINITGNTGCMWNIYKVWLCVLLTLVVQYLILTEIVA